MNAQDTNLTIHYNRLLFINTRDTKLNEFNNQLQEKTGNVRDIYATIHNRRKQMMRETLT